MLIMVFVFGCVQFTFAASRKSIDELLSSYSGNSGNFLGIEYLNQYSSIYCLQTFNGRVCAFVETNGNKLNFGFVSDSPFTFEQYTHDGYTYPYSYDKKDSNGFYVFYSSTNTLNNYKSSILTFATYIDACNYIQTGEINNTLYRPTVYDKSIPTPKNLEIYFDRKLNKPFNLAELCNPLKIKWSIPEDEDYSNYTLDVQIDVNYNKLNSISGIGTKPTVLSTGKVEFASCSATDKELNISATYDGWTKLSEKYQTSIWGLTGNYFDLWLRYKDSSGNFGNWVKVTINPDNSSTVIKAGLFDNGTNTTINKGYEEISGDNGEHVNGDYDNYYVNTLDENISNNLTALKNNYSNLVSFYKELFSFLPAEIWIILIGLVSTMVVIAIIKFVRG